MSVSCKSILIVEDDDDIRFQIVAALEAEEYQVLQATNGQEALEILRAMRSEDLPGCILLDLMMPVMTGKEFIEVIQRDHAEDFGRIKIIVATAKGSPINPELIPRTVERVQKPMELDHLYRIIREHCGHPKD